MILEQIKAALPEAMKQDKKEVVKIYRLILGELQRSFKVPSHDEEVRILKLIIKNNNERMEYYRKVDVLTIEDQLTLTDLTIENQIIETFLPKPLSIDKLRIIISEKKDNILSAKSDGQAIGIAMKYVKEKNLSVNNEDVKILISEMRPNEFLKHGKQDSDLIKGVSMIDGVCCAICYQNGFDCPVQSANNWSKYKNFCSEFNSQYGNLEQTLKHLWGIDTK